MLLKTGAQSTIALAPAQAEQLGKRPFNKKDFDRERSLLEDAISRVEIEATTKRIRDYSTL
jgi:hypothetical protein